MKLFQKSLLFASLLAVGTSVASVPMITNGNGTAQAATTSKLKKKVASDFYYRIGKNKLVKASDMRLMAETNQTASDPNEDPSMDNVEMPSDLKLEVTTPNTTVYTLKGKKTSEKLAKGTECAMGNQMQFFNDSYYQSSKKKMVHVTDNTLA